MYCGRVYLNPILSRVKSSYWQLTLADTYSGFIDRLAKEDMASFPIILKLYQKIFIHDTLKAGVYEVREGMSIRQVLDMISNVDNAEMNRILVIEGTTFKQLIEALKRMHWLKRKSPIYPWISF